jgi:hypothetical protein
MNLSSSDTKCFSRSTTTGNEQRFFVMLGDWTWWAWSITAFLLTIGLAGLPFAFLAAGAVTGVQTIVMWLREKSWHAFPVQLRVACGILLAICFIPALRWLYWLPTVGTYALLIFGYCLMARLLSLLPWNRTEVLSLDLLLRTFTSRPSLARVATRTEKAGCAGGLCSIDAQVRKKST